MISEDCTPSKRRRTFQPSSQDLSSSELQDITHSEETEYAGRILRLEMINFMCHSNLEVTFNPRINFITGCNGSGKSAIMVALVVVLGGSAANTGRGSGVSEFIKKGETSGQVMILLLNEGVNAFKPDLYGNRISITRKLALNGASTFIVKSATGAVISRKKREVDHICNLLRLEIRNPICVLNQDVARNFLTASDSKMRYELFMKATQLRQLEKLHEDTIANITTAKTELDRKSELLSEAKKEVEELRKKLKYLASLKNTALELQSLENEFLWAQVISEEKTIEETKAEKILLEQKLIEINDSINKHKSRVDELEEKEKCIKQFLDQMQKESQELKEERRKLNSEVSQVNGDISKQESHLTLTLPRLQRTLADVARVKEYLQQIDERNQKSSDEHAQITQRIAIVKNELKEINERFAAAERDIENANETKIQSRYAYNELEASVKDLERNKARKIQQLESMRGQDDLEILRFGSYVPNLLEEIERAAKQKQFKKKPIGPLGMYIKLKCDPKWAPAIESVIGAVMTAFCCDNAQDFRVLSQIMNRVVKNKQPTIIISEFLGQRHNVGSHQVSVPGLQNMLSALSISDATAFNTVVDQTGVEGIVLLERDDQAEMLAHVENVPRGLRMAVTLACDRYYPAPNYRTYAGRGGSKFFNQSNRREDVVSKLESEITLIEKELSVRKVEKNTNREKLSKMEEFAKNAEERIGQLRAKKEALQIELGELKDKDETRPVPRTRLALEEELELLEKQKEEIEKDRATRSNAIDKIKERSAESKKKFDAINQNLEKLQMKINEVEGEYNRISDSKKSLAFMESNAGTQLQRINEQIKNHTERQQLEEQVLKAKLDEAVSMCPERIETEKQPVELNALIDKKSRYLQGAKKITGPPADTLEKYEEKKELYYKKLEDKTKIDEDIDFFTTSISNRMKLFNEKLRLSAQEVSYYFRANLMNRGYDGILNFDFENNLLEMEVQPRENDNRTDTKTLSGGERSYSMVSFILAMWRAVVMPFYFLDEFDVFMDRMNRKIAMDLLLEYAHEKKSTQFVFITPLDISAIVASDVISIYRMPDPLKSTQD